MSDRLKNTNQISNEDVIEDLTKDLESSLHTAENPGDTASESVDNPGPSAETRPSDFGDFTDYSDIPMPSNGPMTDSNQDQDPDGKEDSDSDDIDELALKDAEVDLTDDQKEERRIIAEELKVAGNNRYKEGDYEGSIEKYTTALQTCPLAFNQLRSVLYCNRGAGKMKQERYAQAIKDCAKSIELNDTYVKAYLRRAQSYEATEKLDESLADYKKILLLDPSHAEALKASIRLPPLIEEKNEKLKTEMFGKLKDLGNMILRPFGLSTDNFQMEQDPESKGYKINFKQ